MTEPRQTLEQLEAEVGEQIKEQAGRLNSSTLERSLTEPLVEIPELVNNWVRVGDLTLLFGFSGVGKSTIALPLALSLAGGAPFLGFEVPNPEPVLYLDLEMGEYEFRTRLNTLGPQFPDITRQNFHWLSIPNQETTSFKINNLSSKYKLLNEIEAVQPKLLVVDNHTRFQSGNPNAEDEMRDAVIDPFSYIMVTYDLGILYLMHTPLSDKGRPRGTAAILDAASTGIAATKKGADLRERTLHWTKNRSVRRQACPTRMQIIYDPTSFMISPGELSSEDETELEVMIAGVEFPILKSALVRAMRGELGIGQNWAYKTIRRLVSEGRLVADGNMLRLPGESVGEL